MKKFIHGPILCLVASSFCLVAAGFLVWMEREKSIPLRDASDGEGGCFPHLVLDSQNGESAMPEGTAGSSSLKMLRSAFEDGCHAGRDFQSLREAAQDFAIRNPNDGRIEKYLALAVVIDDARNELLGAHETFIMYATIKAEEAWRRAIQRGIADDDARHEQNNVMASLLGQRLDDLSACHGGLATPTLSFIDLLLTRFQGTEIEWHARFLLADRLGQAGMKAPALALLEELAESKTSESWKNRAREHIVHTMDGLDHNNALQYWEASLACAEDNEARAFAQWRLGILHIQARDWPKASKAISHLCQDFPESSYAKTAAPMLVALESEQKRVLRQRMKADIQALMH